VTVIFVMFVGMSMCNNSAHTARIFITFEYIFSKICRGNSSFAQDYKNNGYLKWRPTYVYQSALLNSS